MVTVMSWFIGIKFFSLHVLTAVNLLALIITYYSFTVSQRVIVWAVKVQGIYRPKSCKLERGDASGNLPPNHAICIWILWLFTKRQNFGESETSEWYMYDRL